MNLDMVIEIELLHICYSFSKENRRPLLCLFVLILSLFRSFISLTFEQNRVTHAR